LPSRCPLSLLSALLLFLPPPRPPRSPLFPYTTLFRSPVGELMFWDVAAQDESRALREGTQFIGSHQIIDGQQRLTSLYAAIMGRSEEHTSELQSRFDLVCRLLLEKKNNKQRPETVTTN